MKTIDDLYGVLADDINQAAQAISSALGVDLEEKEHSRFGGRFYETNDPDFGGLTLYPSWNEHYGEWNEPRFSDYRLLVEVTSLSPERAAELEVALKAMSGADAVLLQRGRCDIDDDDYEYEYLFDIRDVS